MAVFVGHGMLAFALVAWGAVALGRPRKRALSLGVLAAAFATVPDVDMAYAPVGLAGGQAAGAVALAELFWSAGNVVHRAVTHSLVVAAAIAAVVALWVGGRRTDPTRAGPLVAAFAGVLALVVVAGNESGPIGAVVMALFATAALLVAEIGRRADVGARAVGATALIGAASHPFGDLLTGEPPAFFYPFETTLVAERVALSADPTLHLLGAFGVELATIWLAALTAAWLVGAAPKVAPEVSLGVGYAGCVLLIPAPTLDLSYPFVFSVLAMGLVGAAPRIRTGDGGLRADLPGPQSACLSALAAVTLAWAAYVAAYLLL